MVKFISYDGSYPNLCSGTLSISIDGNVYHLMHVLSSGGSVTFNSDFEEKVKTGAWKVYNLPSELKWYKNEIENLVNENIPHGCCGGCV